MSEDGNESDMRRLLRANEDDSSSTIGPQSPSSRQPLSWRQKLNQMFKTVVKVNASQDRNGGGQLPMGEDNAEVIKSFRKFVDGAFGGFYKLVIPLSVCFLLTILVVNNLPMFNDKVYMVSYLSPLREKESDPASVKFGYALGNSLIFISVVIVSTSIMVVLYKYECYKIIYSYLIFGSIVFLSLVSYAVLSQVMIYFNVPIDFITCSFLIWNYSVSGMLVIYTRVSPSVQKAYHVLMSSIVSSMFMKILPDWTGWVVMGVLVCWDLVAVLAPFGPLKIFVELAQNRGESIFSPLVFKTMIEPGKMSIHDDHNDQNIPADLNGRSGLWTPGPNSVLQQDEVSGSGHDDPSQSPGSGEVRPTELHKESNEEEEQSAQLGLGDFVFFSLLIGKASIYQDWSVTFSCYIAIMTGLFATFSILVMLGRALPALPISLILGLLFFFSTKFVVSPFFNHLTRNQILV